MTKLPLKDLFFSVYVQEVDAASDEYLRKVSEMSPDKRRAEMEKIQKLFKDAKNYGDEKVSIAIQTYEMVDKHIRRLDGDLAKFEAELREKGRLSQTDDDSEEDEDEDEEKVTKGGRGRKKQASSSASASAGKDKDKDSKNKKQKVFLLKSKITKRYYLCPKTLMP